MLLLTEGIPAIPDLTHSQELLQFGQRVIQLSQWVLLLLLGLGLVLGGLNFSYGHLGGDRGQPAGDRPPWLDLDLQTYSQIWRSVRHGLLMLAILTSGFFLCATLANRYHHWEQEKIAKVAGTVAGERVEQVAPQVRYTVEEPYTTITYIDGKPTEVEKKQKVDRFLSPSASQIEVKLGQIPDPATLRLIYQSEVAADYQVTNSLDGTQDFFFEAPPPLGYSLLQDYRVEQNGKPLQPQNQGEYRFPIRLATAESTQFRVTYKAQGAPRWVYSANGRSLSKFRLSILADFANADFASGIVPSEMKQEGQGTRFTWAFAENVSVQNPFGVFTATQRFRNTGMLPRLLLLAPAVLLGWWLLLYLTGSMRLQDCAIAAAVFFAALLCLTYTSRLMDARLAWGFLMPLLLLFGWGLGNQRQARWGTLIVTLSGVVLPVAAFLVPYTGLTLGIAGLISVLWLLGRYFERQPTQSQVNP